MKWKTLLCGVVALAGASSGQSFAFALAGGYAGPIKIKFSNYEQFIIPQTCLPLLGVGSACTNAGDGVQDAWGTLDITSIQTPTNAPLWSKGTGGEELTGVFYGLDITSITPQGTGFAFTTTGGQLDLYLNPLGTFNAADGTANYTDPGKTQYTDITGGVKFASLLFVSGQEATGASIAGSFDSFNTAQLTGSGRGFLDVIAGSGAYAGNLDSNSTATVVGPPAFRDASFLNNFCTNGRAGCQGQSGPADKIGDWILLSEDPVVGRWVPEPGSLALLGALTLGAGLVSTTRRKLGKDS